MIPLKDNNPTKTLPVVTLSLIFINIAIFLYQLSLGPGGERFIFQMGVIPYNLTHAGDLGHPPSIPPFLTLITAMFLHGGLIHLLGNMLYLWIFGNNIEDSLGPLKFLSFYLICGILASFTHIFKSSDSTTPVIGASGAIAGVLGAYLLLYPKARILTLVFFFYFIRLVKIPAIIVLSFWFLFQVISIQSGGSVAWYAHIGGFIAGVLLVKPFQAKFHR